MKPVLGILLGEATGIGPEIVAKLCNSRKIQKYCRPVLIGDLRVMKMGQEIAGVSYPVPAIDRVSEADWEGDIPILDQRNLSTDDFELGEISAVSGKVTGDMLGTALDLCKNGDLDGFVFAPLNKAALMHGGYDFEDENKYFANYLKWEENYGEMNVVEDLWTSRVTGHIPIKKVADSISTEGVLTAIHLANKTLKQAGYDNPKIAVSALNPHCGEDGMCGTEEIDIIAPAVERAKQGGANVVGPFSADTLFIKALKGEYDAVTVMYHDQGQIALKLQSFENTITVSAGFPYPITTPAHGTAFDIVGKGIAKTSATERAIAVCSRMASNG